MNKHSIIIASFLVQSIKKKESDAIPPLVNTTKNKLNVNLFYYMKLKQ